MLSYRLRWLSRIEGKTRKQKRIRQSWVKPRLEILEDRTLLSSVQILFDYSKDANGFFTQHPEAKATLQDAADDLTSRLSTSTPLLGIQSSGVNTWTATPFDPANPTQTLSIPNLVVPEDDLIVFVGGSDLPSGGELGVGGPGGYQGSGDKGFLNTVQSRGQTGFAPWGGSISFDMSSGINWYFGTSPSVPQNQADFFSVATHELGHLLGIGSSQQWTNLIQSGYFTGNNAEATYGKKVPLDQSEADSSNWDEHWAQTVSSTGPSGVVQQASMDPQMPLGVREYFTTLDFAALKDLGWQLQSGPTIGLLTSNTTSIATNSNSPITFTARNVTSYSGSIDAVHFQYEINNDGTLHSLPDAVQVAGTNNWVLQTPLVISAPGTVVISATASSGGVLGLSQQVTLQVESGTPPPSPPSPSPAPSPSPSPAPSPSSSPASPALQTPPLLAFLDSFLGAVKTVNSDGTETVVDSFFGIPLLVSTYDSAGDLVSVALFGFNVTFLFE